MRRVGVRSGRFVTVFALVVLGVVVLAVPAIAARGFVSTLLSGAEEVPAVVTDGSGSSEFKINTDKRKMCYEIDVSSLSSPTTGAHIHEAPPGENGGIVITLAPPPGTDGQVSDCLKAKRSLLVDILENPSDYYVNIHTQEHSGGEIRGQLEKGKLPAE